ncbi:uncharacterized protein LOC119400867 [Rhipicephalus sanguineus]|uniref:uncharacterized protein LOC119400867 n=1 Tax=Rhipicephalus sanguineus TaxID=34632 RepID=UPI001894B63B|nr:uncharacterized protein LOC119400867 [Rhipicephalus sanguineus]
MSCTKVMAAVLVVAIAASGAAASAPSCINITLTNILGIGNCIGSSTNFCGSSNASASAQAIATITRCAIQGIVANGSPQGIIDTLLPLLVITVSRYVPGGANLGSLLNTGGLGGLGMGSLVRNDSCNGSINIALSAMGGNLSSCTGDILMTCTAGSPTTTSMIQSDFQAIACLLRQLPASQFATAAQSFVCPLLQAVSSAGSSNIFLQLALIGIRTSLQTALGIQCSSLPSLPTFG